MDLLLYAAIEVRDNKPAFARKKKPVGRPAARGEDRRGVFDDVQFMKRALFRRFVRPMAHLQWRLQRCPQLIVLPTRFDVYPAGRRPVVREILHRFNAFD